MKARPDLLPADALLAVSRVMAHGAAKHGARGWEAGRSRATDYGALLRHLWAWWRGEARDPDSGESHLAHAAARAMILLGAELRGLPGDDRLAEAGTPVDIDWNEVAKAPFGHAIMSEVIRLRGLADGGGAR